MSSIQGQYGALTMRNRNFICNAPQAKQVSLVGDFNGWNPISNPMQKTPDGAWLVRVELKHGHHRYAFLVDGQMVLDPTAMGITRDDHGKRVSLIANS
jgi:1,4-alpha-glucan branching enzyme